MKPHDHIIEHALAAEVQPPVVNERSKARSLRTSSPTATTATTATPSQTVISPTTIPPAATGSNASMRKRGSASKTVYFSDDRQLSDLEALARKFPRCSASSIMQQLTVLLLASSSKINEESRKVCIEGTIYF